MHRQIFGLSCSYSVRSNQIADQNQISSAKPSYIIEMIQDGIANMDDLLWRLIADRIQIDVFNGVDDGWLYISDVGRVAAKTVDYCDSSGQNYSITHIDIAEGILASECWFILVDEFAYILAQCSKRHG